YPKAVAILQASWNWPFDIKNMDVYGRTGYAKTIRARQIEVRRQGEKDVHISDAAAIAAPYDDPLHYLAAVIRGDISEDDDLSSIQSNEIEREVRDVW